MLPSIGIVGAFSKMQQIKYRRYFFNKVAVKATSVLLEYRVPISAYRLCHNQNKRARLQQNQTVKNK